MTGAAAQENTTLWYEIERINPGLGAPPEGVDRKSPRTALRTFVDFAESGNFDAAAHYLNLSELQNDAQAAQGPELARKLAGAIDRKLWIYWTTIPSTPDARGPRNSTEDTAAQPQRDYLISQVNVDGQTHDIRLRRYAVETADGEIETAVWLFASDTVSNIDTLYDAFGPRAFESNIPEELKRKFGGLRLWEWIALPVFLMLVIGVAVATSRMVRLGARLVRHRIVTRAFDRAALPLSLVTASAAAQWLLGFTVSFSGPVTTVVTPFLVLLTVVGVSLAALRSVDTVLGHITRRYLGDDTDMPNLAQREFYTSIYALRRGILVVAVLFSLIFLLLQFNLFADIGVSLFASAGVLTVILGIAGQATLGNMVASLQIAIAKPVRIGDTIVYDDDWCVVEAIFFTFIRLRRWDNKRIIVPIKEFLSQPFQNWSVVDERVDCVVKLLLDPMAEVAVLREKFVEIAREEPAVSDHDNLSTYVTAHSSDGLTVEFFAVAPNPAIAWTIEMRLREALVDFVRTEHPQWWPHKRLEM
ncbi:MAG: mechanosensitive ion channel [Roseovarius sp.]|nr:mechanosensitive ion channel [Roseovarius sp.]